MRNALGIACILHVLSCAGGGRDVEGAPPAPRSSSHAAAAASSSAAAPADAGADASAHPDYERLLTRAHATFGLAEARGIEPERLTQVLESVANGFEACAANAQREGWLERGALRLVVEVDMHGQVAGVDVQLDDPSRGGKVALVCLVAPVKAQNFGAESGSGRRGLALEVLFSPARAP